MTRSYDEVMAPLREADDETSKAQLSVFERAYELAGQIASLRAKRGLTQLELAAAAGMTQADVSKIERGVTHPSSRTLHRLASALCADLALVERSAS